MASPGHIHHLELYVGSVEKSRAFWEPFLAHFGYRVFQFWPEGISFILDETYLVLVQVEPAYLTPEYHRKRVGLNHLAFHARSWHQVDQLTAWARARGHPILYQDRHPYAGGGATYALYLEDPDRLKVEIVAPSNT